MNVEIKTVFYRGRYRLKALREAVLEATGWSRWHGQDEWIMCGLADDDSRGLATGMPFSPPQEERTTVGFVYGTTFSTRSPLSQMI